MSRLWPMAMRAMIGPAPKISVTVVLATRTASAMRRERLFELSVEGAHLTRQFDGKLVADPLTGSLG